MKSNFKTNFNSKVMMVVISLVCGITMLMVPTLALASNFDNAKEVDAQPKWTFLCICDNFIDYATNIKKGLAIGASTQTYYDYYAGVDVQLERYTTSNIWVNVPTYCWSAYEEDDYAEVSVDDVHVAPGIYRCSLDHTAYDKSGLPMESEVLYTSEIRIPD